MCHLKFSKTNAIISSLKYIHDKVKAGYNKSYLTKKHNKSLCSNFFLFVFIVIFSVFLVNEYARIDHLSKEQLLNYFLSHGYVELLLDIVTFRRTISYKELNIL